MLILAVQCILQKLQAVIELSVLFQFSYLIFIIINGSATKRLRAECKFCCTLNAKTISKFVV